MCVGVGMGVGVGGGVGVAGGGGGRNIVRYFDALTSYRWVFLYFRFNW